MAKKISVTITYMGNMEWASRDGRLKMVTIALFSIQFTNMQDKFLHHHTMMSVKQSKVIK
jgi:hypothetical protein